MGADYRAIGQRIKQRRRAIVWTQDKLAEELQVTVGYISQIERGVSKVNLNTLAEIAATLDCDIAELVTGTVTSQNAYLQAELGKKFEMLNEGNKRILLEIAEVLLQGQ